MTVRNALLFLAIWLVVSGCSATDTTKHKTWFDLVEISDNIMRAKEQPADEPPDEGAEIVAPVAETKIKDLSVSQDSGNPFLKSMEGQKSYSQGESVEGEGVMLNFDNADIYEVIQVIAELLDLSYIIDPQVKGVVNIRSGSKIPNDQLFVIFKKILNVNGLDIRSEGEHDYIYVAAKPTAMAIYDRDQVGNLKESSRLITQIVPVLHISSAEAQKLVEPYLSEHSVVYNLADQNLLIVSDFESQIIDALMILARLDTSSLASLVVRLVRIENAPLFDLKDELNEVLVALKVNKKDYEGVQIMPLERVNSLLLIGYNESLVETAIKWIAELDRAPTEGRDSVYIYNVRNSVATELSDLVSSLISEKTSQRQKTTSTSSTSTRTPVRPPGTTTKTSGTVPAPTTTTRSTASESGAGSASMQFAGEPVLIPDDARNIVLIRALFADYRRVLKLLERLDNLPMQVLIEVMVAEVSLSDDLSHGLEWALKNNELKISTGEVTFTGSSGLAGSFSAITGTDIFKLLKLVASKNDVTVLSSPQVLVLNNESATVNVGEQVPIVTSQISDTSASTTSNQTIQYKDTGVILNVTPRINKNGIIIMEIDQQVSTAQSLTTGGLQSPTISTKQIKTKVAVKDGQSILMGGLIDKNETDTESGIPVLKDIPYLGNVFKTKSRSSDKTELLVVVTPYVIESENVLDQYVKNFQQKVLELRTELTAQ